MLAFVGQRILTLVPLLLGVTLFAFLLISSAPGDPIAALLAAGDTAVDVETIEARRRALGLDDALPVQYARWVGRLVQGDLGRSFATGRPVAQDVAQRLRATGRLAVTALVVALLVGVTGGVMAAVRRGTWVDQAVTFVAFLAVATPPFFVGLALIYVFSLKLGVLPTGGMGRLGGGGGLVDGLRHMLLPTVVLALPLVAEVLRYTRGSMLEVLDLDFVRTARGKGAPERRVRYRHALRNALLPVITVTALALPSMLGGAIVTETVFQWPGLGALTLEAVLQRDYPIILAVTLVSGVAVVAANLIADVLYAVADPRVRVST
jgi:peptide/nickel transport system permease protein